MTQAEAIEADLARYYRLALSDLHAGRLSWRRLRVLIRNLPADSALMRAVHGERARWGDSEHLLAAIFDVLRWANWQRGGGRGTRPQPLQRPGTDNRIHLGRAERSTDEVRAYLARFKPAREVSDATRN